MMHKSKWNLAILAAALLATACSKSHPDAVFLVVVDTLRPDRLSCYGYDLYQTTHIDALAAEGVRFRNAESAASWTIPAMGTIMTSLYPTQLGLVERPVPGDSTLEWRTPRGQVAYTLDQNETALAELMKETGFRTAAFVDQPAITGTDGFMQGFDDWYYAENVETIKRYDPNDPPAFASLPAILDNARVIDGRLVDELDGWLSRNKGEKVFVWIHLLTPHRPYNPPPWTERRSSSTREQYARPGVTDAYDGEVLAADELVGRIVSLADANYGPEHSAIVLVSDHGEAFGEHGMAEHGHTLYGEVVRVPMIIRAPAATPGATVNATVCTVDVLPTILDLAGAKGRIPADARGESLVPMFAGAGRHRLVYSEGMLYGSTERSIIVDGKKLMVDLQVPGVRLYDEIYDPEGLIDLAPGRAELADSLLAELSSLHAELEADYERRVGNRTVSKEQSDSIQKVLHTLGYIDIGVRDTTGTQ